jgi:hypothetical protein
MIMIKFYRIASIACAIIGGIGYGVLLYLHGTNNTLLREPLWQDCCVDVHIFLMGGSFVWILACALTHSLYLYEKQMKWW